jgi:hypothetical protein
VEDGRGWSRWELRWSLRLLEGRIAYQKADFAWRVVKAHLESARSWLSGVTVKVEEVYL